MKNLIDLPKNMGLMAVAALFSLLFSVNACQDAGCGYEEIATVVPDGCKNVDSLNLSTGLDTSGLPITAAVGAVDPFWKLLNNPPRVSCADPLEATIGSNAYAVNFLSSGTSGWVNQPGATTLAPVDMGNTSTGFGCNNALNSKQEAVPYVFERPFCVLKNTAVDLNFTYKGDDQIRFELVENATGTVVNSSLTYVWPAPVATWAATGLPLNAGSHSIRAYLVNDQGYVLGFSMLGGLTTTKGDAVISSNAAGCCENNTISILNILEEKCNGLFDPTGDQVGNGWTFNLKDAGGTIIQTGVTDINGNLFFAGLPDGTYTVESVPTGGWLPSLPVGGTVTVVVSGNEVKVLAFYNCR